MPHGHLRQAFSPTSWTCEGLLLLLGLLVLFFHHHNQSAVERRRRVSFVEVDRLPHESGWYSSDDDGDRDGDEETGESHNRNSVGLSAVFS
ncbi:protein RL8A [Human betaherpesvirus 5]|uniref:Protein RL8A n=1 Tax=Human cytomegalovirus TaxID=10359 RepID=A0A0G2TX34_HCMV|nr:protein RL8A [Human betaherpesvirus 5]